MRAATAEPTFQEFYAALLAKGMKLPRARLRLARKIATITLLIWKKGMVTSGLEQDLRRRAQARTLRLACLQAAISLYEVAQSFLAVEKN